MYRSTSPRRTQTYLEHQPLHSLPQHRAYPSSTRRPPGATDDDVMWCALTIVEDGHHPVHLRESVITLTKHGVRIKAQPSQFVVNIFFHDIVRVEPWIEIRQLILHTGAQHQRQYVVLCEDATIVEPLAALVLRRVEEARHAGLRPSLPGPPPLSHLHTTHHYHESDRAHHQRATPYQIEGNKTPEYWAQREREAERDFEPEVRYRRPTDDSDAASRANKDLREKQERPSMRADRQSSSASHLQQTTTTVTVEESTQTRARRHDEEAGLVTSPEGLNRQGWTPPPSTHGAAATAQQRSSRPPVAAPERRAHFSDEDQTLPGPAPPLWLLQRKQTDLQARDAALHHAADYRPPSPPRDMPPEHQPIPQRRGTPPPAAPPPHVPPPTSTAARPFVIPDPSQAATLRISQRQSRFFTFDELPPDYEQRNKLNGEKSVVFAPYDSQRHVPSASPYQTSSTHLVSPIEADEHRNREAYGHVREPLEDRRNRTLDETAERKFTPPPQERPVAPAVRPPPVSTERQESPPRISSSVVPKSRASPTGIRRKSPAMPVRSDDGKPESAREPPLRPFPQEGKTSANSTSTSATPAATRQASENRSGTAPPPAIPVAAAAAAKATTATPSAEASSPSSEAIFDRTPCCCGRCCSAQGAGNSSPSVDKCQHRINSIHSTPINCCCRTCC